MIYNCNDGAPARIRNRRFERVNPVGSLIKYDAIK